jgi:hypothetical protein
MPFKSKAQAKYMYANMPKMAKDWAQMTGDMSKLPAKVHRTSAKAAAKKAGY